MPLSDREQQILEDIERQLYEQDPKFARDVASTSLAADAVRNIKKGTFLLALGFIVLLAAFFEPSLMLPIGLIAFLLMVGGATVIYNNVRKVGAEKIKQAKEQSPINGLFGRVEDRFRDIRRRGDDS